MIMDDNFNKWLDQWDAAQKSGIFDKPAEPEKEGPSEDEIRQWKYLNNYFHGKTTPEEDDPVMVTEAATDKEVSDKAKAMANSHNPIHQSTVGVDQNPGPTPNWTDGKELKELAELKMDLEKLECKWNAALTTGSDTSKVQSQIDELRQKISDLSNSLSGSPVGVENN